MLEGSAKHLARIVFFVFLATFVSARIFSLLIMARKIPDFFLVIGGTHVHHFNYGIFLLIAVGAYLLLFRPASGGLHGAAVLYGIGLALTFDEFGMLLHLGGGYWQRASFDAVAVVSALLGLLAFAPPVSAFRSRHWWAAGIAIAGSLVFFLMLADSFRWIDGRFGPALKHIEQEGSR